MTGEDIEKDADTETSESEVAVSESVAKAAAEWESAWADVTEGGATEVSAEVAVVESEVVVEEASEEPAEEPVEEIAGAGQTLATALEDAQVMSIIESLLFASVHPVPLSQLRGIFHGTNVNTDRLRTIITQLETQTAGGDRGVIIEEVAGGYQLRTKAENSPWLQKLVKARPFKLSGPALEVLSIIAYKQPVVKSEVDEIRGVESGHLVRALMEKNLIKFAGKSELPGKPMLYGTTKQFLELFGLRNIRELPTLSEIDKLIPEGIGETDDVQGETLGQLAEKIGLDPGKTYSEAEGELLSITEALSDISTSSEFFEEEKRRERERRDNERAQDLRERQIVGEVLPDVDAKWLAKFDAKIEAEAQKAQAAAAAAAEEPIEVPVGASGCDGPIDLGT